MSKCENCGCEYEGRSIYREGKFGEEYHFCSNRCADEWEERKERKERKAKRDDEEWVKAHPTLASIRTKIRITIVIAIILFIIYCIVSK